MAKKEIGAPVWVASEKRWRLRKQKNKKKAVFYSTDPSPRRGPAECRRQCEEWLESFERASTTSDKDFEEIWEEYLEYYGGLYKPTSLRQLEGRGKAHLVPAFRYTALADIKKADWQQVIFDAHKNGAKSFATLKGIATTIRSFCKWCASVGYMMDVDVPIYFAYPTHKLIQEEKRILQPNDFKLLLSVDQDDADWYINAWRFLALTGIRRGELCALQLRRDYDGESITIRESISHEQLVTDGKTPQAQRRICLGKTAQEVLRKFELQLMKAGKRKRTYLFTDENGYRISPRTLRNHWQSWRELHGIDITLHELRHTLVSYSRLETDIDLDELKELYGHSEKMNTDKVYVHAIQDTPAEARKKRARAKEIADKIDSAIMNLLEKA